MDGIQMATHIGSYRYSTLDVRMESSWADPKEYQHWDELWDFLYSDQFFYFYYKIDTMETDTPKRCFLSPFAPHCPTVVLIISPGQVTPLGDS